MGIGVGVPGPTVGTGVLVGIGVAVGTGVAEAHVVNLQVSHLACDHPQCVSLPQLLHLVPPGSEQLLSVHGRHDGPPVPGVAVAGGGGAVVAVGGGGAVVAVGAGGWGVAVGVGGTRLQQC